MFTCALWSSGGATGGTGGTRPPFVIRIDFLFVQIRGEIVGGGMRFHRGTLISYEIACLRNFNFTLCRNFSYCSFSKQSLEQA